MPQKLQQLPKVPTVIAIAILVLILASVAAMFAWDASRADTIANDVPGCGS